MTLTPELVLAIAALLCVIVDWLRPTPHLLHVATALLSVAVILVVT